MQKNNDPYVTLGVTDRDINTACETANIHRHLLKSLVKDVKQRKEKPSAGEVIQISSLLKKTADSECLARSKFNYGKRLDETTKHSRDIGQRVTFVKVIEKVTKSANQDLEAAIKCQTRGLKPLKKHYALVGKERASMNRFSDLQLEDSEYANSTADISDFCEDQEENASLLQGIYDEVEEELMEDMFGELENSDLASSVRKATLLASSSSSSSSFSNLKR
ncbi:hypothetical protein CAPTEDRAFT_187518 [Capitella teleta]|jgi:hypothetical protein|uniref:Uncharacterized protein n=1 Tax=Capitella teleta TaxID=283909 RepID=R7TNH8_CAPTE|nr:hypothetical protein CAPTEDRAFT_187518 [Capitella teleta]|eukprot:ELT95189.1 hypothetical protein CAPTEDRAFT_187518 [Capitella teleta]